MQVFIKIEQLGCVCVCVWCVLLCIKPLKFPTHVGTLAPTSTYILANTYGREPPVLLSLFLKFGRGNTLCTSTEFHSFLPKEKYN